MQEDIIRSVITGNHTLAILPTGGGKSICFQVPAMMQEGMCLVVSPLIALMKDQVEQLNIRNIPAQSIHTGLSNSEIQDILELATAGALKFLYVSPERLDSSAFKNELSDMNIRLLAIDEAHCISQWGYDFRPAYLKINQIRKQLPDIPVIALTASATEEVQEDIAVQLHLHTLNRFRQSFERPNLAYFVIQPESKHHYISEIFNGQTDCGIVYCKSRRQTKAVADLLIMKGVSADFYHAGLTTETRTRKQEDWVSGRTKVMVCTNAFGMGIDKPDVRLVVHFDTPDCLENYYQEAGRAGRDLQYSKAILLTTPGDAAQLRNMVNTRFPSYEQIKSVYLALMNYLGVPAGIGAGNLYPFDPGRFSENFRLNILESTYAIQALEKAGILSFNESTWQPSTVRFTVETETLRSLDTGFEHLNQLIKGLLRMYEGILDHDVKLNEFSLARFMYSDMTEIIQSLHQLHGMGIIEYRARIEQPSVFLTLNRMYQDDFSFNYTEHLKRKEVFSKRLEHMVTYLEQQHTCRSTFIAHYFGDTSVQDCGICDICLQKKEKNVSGNGFAIAEKILELLRHGPVKINTLESQFGLNATRNAIHLLETESMILLNERGELVRVKA